MPAQHKSEPGFLETFFRNIVGPFFIFLGSPVLYPLKKMFNAGRNILFRHTKRGRSLGRLIGIGISGYIGVSQGAAVGAAFGSVVLPGVGTVAGSLLGALIGAVIGGNIGALITKYVAKRLSELVYEDTNPDKWTLTLNQAVEMSQKVTSIQEIETPASPQPKNSPNKVSLSVVLRAMDAVDAAKKQTQGLGNIPGTLVRERKNKFNDLLEKIKNGKFDEGWHQGVIGILAGRMKDRLHRPVIAFALANEKELKGSARSISGLHIRDVLADIAATHPTLIDKFGGHAMAAGLTLSRAHFDQFSRVFNQIVSAKLNEMDLQNALLSDGELDSSTLSLESAELLREAGPWGQSFPEPLFDGVFQILEQRLVGGRHLKLVLSQSEKMIDAIAFNVDINQWPDYRCDAVRIAYRLDVNEYRSKRSVQLIIEHIEAEAYAKNHF